jgi:phosphoadenosine phosphosulfate reductase
MNESEFIKTLIEPADIVGSLQTIATTFPGQVAFSTSFGLEDQALTHLIFSNNIPIEVFTLDTGRQFAETYSVWSRTLEKYGKPVKVYYPKAELVENLVSSKGPNSFYLSVENRKECCFVRKVEPLQRALTNKKIWVTGIRAEQSAVRTGMEQVEWSEANRITKYHPILHWTFEETKEFIRENDVPYNALHDRGFVSIGCAPCTRAIKAGEQFRAGRWWWEASTAKECGLHEVKK